MNLAVVVTSYNRPDALSAVLRGYAGQSDSDFELIVADDGSTGETGALVRRFAAQAPFAVRHVWHEDDGFRAAAIRNKAVLATTADYIVFTDGDCVPPVFFTARQRALAEAEWFVAGNRLLLSESFTRRVLASGEPFERWRLGRWMGAWMRRDINRWLPLLRLPDGAWRKRAPRRWEGIKTCNLSVWREDLIQVNGLDESYSGWGMEDSDLVVRLLRAGVRHKSARFAAPVFHLWHRENDRSHLAENRARLQEALDAVRIRARRGLDHCATADVGEA
ncbi:MAG: glycosyltransferase family 2 protein [Betaproteobacteria bacterium]